MVSDALHPLTSSHALVQRERNTPGAQALLSKILLPPPAENQSAQPPAFTLFEDDGKTGGLSLPPGAVGFLSSLENAVFTPKDLYRKLVVVLVGTDEAESPNSLIPFPRFPHYGTRCWILIAPPTNTIVGAVSSGKNSMPHVHGEVYGCYEAADGTKRLGGRNGRLTVDEQLDLLASVWEAPPEPVAARQCCVS